MIQKILSIPILLFILITGLGYQNSPVQSRAMASPSQFPTGGAYWPPIGIPAPTFGINEVAPEWPAVWPSAEVSGYYFVDNTHPEATDTNNSYGYPNKPRLTIPDITYTAGSYIEVHGGPYTDSYIDITFDCTQTAPCWLRGTADDMPKFSGTLRPQTGSAYAVIEYIDFDQGSNSGFSVGAGAHHLALRHSIIQNKTYVSNSAGVGLRPPEGQTLHDIVIYNNVFRELGDWLATEDEDFHGLNPNLWGRDENSGSELYNVWILENICYHVSGNCVQVNAGNGQRIYTFLHHIYVGKNVAYDNRQAGFWSKQARDVIFSQNVAYGGRTHGHQPGDGIGYQYNPDNLWIIYNELYDNNFGIRQSSTDGDPTHTVYIIGNIIHDNETGLDPCGHWGSPTGWGISLWQGNQTRYIVNNTIYNTRGGIELILSGDSAPTYLSNNIISNLNGMDYFNDDEDECGTGFTVSPGKVQHLAIGSGVEPDTAVDYNLFFQPLTDPVKLNGYEGLAAYQNATGECIHCLQSDPTFIDGPNTNLNLKSDSAAIDAGIEDAVYQTYWDLYGINLRLDFANKSRPVGANWDMGAYEYIPLFLDGSQTYLPVILHK